VEPADVLPVALRGGAGKRMKRTAEEFDIIIVGAGAAGLSAAAALASKDLAVTIVDARERLGGRILTLRDPNGLPIELGAEFIHGESPATLDWLKRAGLPVLDAPQVRWILRRGLLQPGQETFNRMRQELSRARVPGKDVTFAEFLERRSSTLSPSTRLFARAMVEGFDAADATLVSAKATLEEWGGDNAADAPTFRPLSGYMNLIDALCDSARGSSASIKLDTVVREIEWKRGAVAVRGTRHGKLIELRARKVLVTVPLGVLKLAAAAPSSIRFQPALKQKITALTHLGVGPVVKLALQFSRPFWEEIEDGKFRDAAFFQAPSCPFPTVWTTLPARTSRLIAWAGGPKAFRLAGADRAELVSLALHTLKSMFGATLDYASLLESMQWHDWQRDPWACGAYSYEKVGGARARKVLAAPVENTVYFAGEATDAEESGGVGGAVQSGCDAARRIVEQSSNQRR
jgi:monoamine oxidase